MASEIELKERWIDKEDLIVQIIGCLKNHDNSWSTLIKDLQYIEEIDNHRDLRGIPLANYDLKAVSFKNISLRYADFTGADLEEALFHHVDLRNSNLSGTKLNNADLQTADLRGAILEDIQVNEDTDWGTSFARFIQKRKRTQSRLKFILTQRIIRYFGYKGKIYSESLSKTKEDYRATQQVYRAIRIAYRNIDSVTADYFSYREFHCELVLHPWWHPAKWVGILWEKISCSGTSPARLFLFVIFSIYVWAFIYFITPEGIIRSTPEGYVPLNDFGEALYFSIITFTSLGYGDFHPNHDSVIGSYLKYICSLEALAGIISLALLIAVFLRFLSKD